MPRRSKKKPPPGSKPLEENKERPAYSLRSRTASTQKPNTPLKDLTNIEPPTPAPCSSSSSTNEDCITPLKDLTNKEAATSSLCSSSVPKSRILSFQLPLSKEEEAFGISYGRKKSKRPPGAKLKRLYSATPSATYVLVQCAVDPLPLGQIVTKKSGSMKVQITNGCNGTKLARIEVFKTVDDINAMWETYIGDTIQCVEFNSKLLVACCEDFNLHVYRMQSGARALPPLFIEDALAVMCLTESSVCMVVTKAGLLHMWNIDLGKSVLGRISLKSLLSEGEYIRNCSLTSLEMPLITLNNGKAYTYSLDLQTWVLVLNPKDPLNTTGSEMAMAMAMDYSLPLASLQKQIPKPSVDNIVPSGVVLSFLERQTSSSIALGSHEEFRHWLLTTIGHLVDEGPECKIRAILDDLSQTSSKPTPNTIWGISKKKMLSEVLAIIKTRLVWRELYEEYNVGT